MKVKWEKAVIYKWTESVRLKEVTLMIGIVTADFIAMYKPGFSDMIRLSWFDNNHLTYIGFAVRKRLQKYKQARVVPWDPKQLGQ